MVVLIHNGEDPVPEVTCWREDHGNKTRISALIYHMKARLLVVPVVAAFSAVALTGCTSTQLRSDAATAAAIGVPETLEAKIKRGRALTPDEIAALSRQGVPDDVILRNIETSLAVYQLETADVDRLRSLGINTTVIDAMIASGARHSSPGYRSGVGYHHRGYHLHHPRHHYGGRRHHHRHHYRARHHHPRHHYGVRLHHGRHYGGLAHHRHRY